jgi:hypothetical protein
MNILYYIYIQVTTYYLDRAFVFAEHSLEIFKNLIKIYLFKKAFLS